MGRKSYTRLVTWLTATIVLAADASAQRPDARYRTLESEHFRVTFGPGLDSLAGQAAEISERTRAHLVEQLTAPPGGKVDIILIDDVDFSNGFANVFPSNRVVIYVRPPVDEEALSYNADWLELVLSHELTHIYHLDRAGAAGRALRKVFGRLPLVYPMFPAVATPSWSTEGLAVDVESAFTGFGRVYGSNHEMVVRTAALENRFDRMDRLNESSPIWPGDQRVYIYGSLFMHWLGERYGEDVHRRILEKTSSAFLPPFLFFDAVAKRAFGASFDEAYAEWRSEVERATQRLADSLRAERLTTSDRVTTHPRRALFPRVSPDGQRLAYMAEDGRSTPQVRILDVATGEEVENHRRNSIGSHSWTADSRLLISQFEFENPYQIRNDLWLVGRGGRRVTRKQRLQDPDVARDGDRVVAIQNDAGATRLVVLRLSSDDVRPITPADPDVLWSWPRWSPDGERIAVTRWRRGGDTDIVIVDTTANVLQTVISGPWLNLTPAWTSEGRWLLFSSDRTGISNLYAADVSSDGAPSVRQITNVLTGAFQPEGTPDGQWIYYSAYHSDGYAIERMRFDTASWRAPMAVKARVVTPSEPGAVRNGQQGAAQMRVGGYSPWRSLLPKAWQPVLFSGAGDYAGVAIAGEDLVARHAFSAWAALEVSDRKLWQGAIAYRNARLGNPTLTLEASRFWDDLGSVLLPDSTTTNAFEREDQLSALLTFTRRRWRSIASVSVGVEREHVARTLEDAPGFRFRDADDIQYALLGRVSLGTAQQPEFAVSREDGIGLSVTGRRSVESDGTVLRDSTGESRADFNEVRGVATAYKSLSFGGFAHHVLALRGSAHFSDGPGAKLAGIGGSTGAGAALLGFSLTQGSRLLPVRGFDGSVLAGTRAWSASAEWRIPLALTGRRPSLSPVFIDRISGALFMDAGDAWCTASEEAASSRCHAAAAANTPIMSAGAELIFDVGFAGILSARLRTGVGIPVRGPRDGAKLYIELGSNY